MDNHENCIYCNQTSERSKSVLLKICDLSVCEFFLNQDQSFKGRAIVAFKDHKEELFELTPQEQEAFVKDLSAAAKAIYEYVGASKMNYVVLGDNMKHFHVHLIPKHEADADYGKPVDACARPELRLLQEEYAEIMAELKKRVQ